MSSDTRVTVICADAHAWQGFATFNPNKWSGESRGVVQACATEIGVQYFAASRIASLCQGADVPCQPRFEQLHEQWRHHPWESDGIRYFVEVPELHAHIQGFLAGIKSILDLVVQLLSTEGVVGARVDGFHRKGRIYGGSVLNALEHNAIKGRELRAARLCSILIKAKDEWADQVIEARDGLVHPRRGAQQLMLEMQIENVDGELVLRGTHPPHVEGEAIDHFAIDRIERAREFSVAFMQELRSDG